MAVLALAEAWVVARYGQALRRSAGAGPLQGQDHVLLRRAAARYGSPHNAPA